MELTFQEQIARLTISKILTPDDIPDLQEQLDKVLKNKSQKLEIDLEDCHIITSLGIGKIISFTKDFKTKKKGEVEIIKCSESILKLFHSIKLETLIPITEN